MGKKVADDIVHLLRRLDVVRDKISARNADKDLFNVFSCLKIEKDEVKHSRLISSLLDPRAPHQLGFSPVKHLIAILDSSFQYGEDSLEVHPSFTDCREIVKKGEYKRIDILLIDKKKGYAVIIENKIGAPDSNHDDEGQLECYYRRVIEEDHIPQKNVEVYYLTLDGHEPSEASVATSKRYKELPNIVRCITYGNEILTWLKQCMQEACEKPYLRETIAQYINLIKKMTNDTDVEDRLEIIKIISRNDDALASAKLLFDNYKHIQWHTIFDLFNDFYAELEQRGYTCLSKVETSVITDIVHGGPVKRHQQDPNFDVKDRNGVEIAIGCDQDGFYFGLRSKTNKNLDKRAIINSPHMNIESDPSRQIDKDWTFNQNFSCPEEKIINIWDFSRKGTFRIINSKTRKETIKEYLDNLEDFLYDKVNIYKYLR